MNIVMSILDSLWNLKFITGYRTIVAKAFLIGVSAYQWVATASPVIKAGLDLPDVPNEIYGALVIYFSAKLEQFAKEHV